MINTPPSLPVVPRSPEAITALQRALEEARQPAARPSAVALQLLGILNVLSAHNVHRNASLISTDTHVPLPTSQTVQSMAGMRASRAGLGLAQILRWRTSCPEGWVRDELSSIARYLVDNTNGNCLSRDASALIRGLPKSHEGCGTFPWEGDDLERLSLTLGSTDHSVQMGIDTSTLGARSLAGVLIAHLWAEPVLQRTEGPLREYSAAPLLLGMPTEPGNLLKQATAAALQGCIGALATCDSVADIKACLNNVLAAFEQPQRLQDGRLAYADRLRSALKIVNAEEANVSEVGEKLMNPPQRPYDGIPQSFMSVWNFHELAA